MSALGRSPFDHSKTIRRFLADGKTLDDALSDLRKAGDSILDCIVSVRTVYGCSLEEAKRLVASSPSWADVAAATEADFQKLLSEAPPQI